MKTRRGAINTASDVRRSGRNAVAVGTKVYSRKRRRK